jgi:hypothetical protein
MSRENSPIIQQSVEATKTNYKNAGWNHENFLAKENSILTVSKSGFGSVLI